MVSFTSLIVEQLVKDFHGRQMEDGRLVVKDTSIACMYSENLRDAVAQEVPCQN